MVNLPELSSVDPAGDEGFSGDALINGNNKLMILHII